MNKKKVLILSLFYLLSHHHSAHGVNGNIEFMTAIPTNTGVRLYDVTKPARQDNGFEVLPDMTKADFAERFDRAFSESSWVKYDKFEKITLSLYLKYILKRWALIEKAQGRPFFDDINIKTLFSNQIKGGLYNPCMHPILSEYIQHIFAPANAGHIASKLCEQYIRLASHMLNKPIAIIYQNGPITGVRRNIKHEIKANLAPKNVIYKDNTGWYTCKYNNNVTQFNVYSFAHKTAKKVFQLVSYEENKVFRLPAECKIKGGFVDDTKTKMLKPITEKFGEYLNKYILSQ